MGTLWWLIIWSLVGAVLSLCPTNTEYTIPTFGDHCNYRCHCDADEQCDKTSGECPSDCASGWMGPACQYRNIALNRTRFSQYGNAPLPSDYAIDAADGRMDTCSKTYPSRGAGDQYWWIQLDRVYYIVGLLLHLPSGDSLEAFRVEVANETSFNPSDVRQCVRYSKGPRTGVVEVMCIEPILARVLKIVREDDGKPLSLCEVQIYGGRHISFNKNTTQQSTLDYGGHIWDSSLAVDGTGARASGNEHGYTCSATNGGGGERWWQLDLPNTYRIEDIYIFGRPDHHISQTRAFNLTIDSKFTHKDTPTNSISDYLPRTLNIIEPVDGQTIRVTKQNILVLCEVIVYGECIPNYCGSDCTQECMCSSVTTGTPRLSGVCPYGCTGRWTGTGGKCTTECSMTEWGPYCNNTCGNCANTDACDVTTGLCPQGCSPSWKLDLCTENCDDGWWGANCSNACGNCTDGKPCNKTDGTCDGGCIPGYKPNLCSEECDLGMYGLNCSSKCGNCTETEGVTGCRPDTGVCPSGCQLGYKPPTCHDECDDGWWGANCSSKCGSCAADIPCNKIDGTCPDGCLSGFKAPLCKEECDAGTYGVNCTSACGNCTEIDGVTTCRTDTGDCPAGCPLGLQPPKCQEACAMGRFGINCYGICGACADSTRCMIEDGSCQGGCADGYQGEMCQQKIVDDENNTVWIIGGAVAAAFVIAMVAVGLVLYRRCRRNDKPTDRVAIPMNPLHNDGDASPRKSELAESGAYYNFKLEELDSHSHRTIPVSELRRFASTITEDPGQLYTDYSEIPRLVNHPASDGRATANVSKNKYKDIVPYDMNRVKLQELPGVENSDYINASYIQGYTEGKKYIASQGPLERTVNDFWRMVWEQDVALIVMLTNCMEMGKMKCIQYWPEHDHVTYDGIEVTLLSQNVYSEFTIRHLQCDKGSQSRRIVQYHYTAWPDKDVPDTALSLVKFWRRVRASENHETTPWLVHCSAGVGRTGTFITLDHLYEKGSQELSINVYQCVTELRQQRPIMVQTQAQYVFIHLVVTEALLPIGTIYSVDQFPHELANLTAQASGQPTILFREYQELEAIRIGNSPECEYGNISNHLDVVQCAESFKPENVGKSRNTQILPPDAYRAKLLSPLDGYNDYINAVTVPTFQNRGGLVLTQVPLSHTIVDFIRLLVSYRVKVIVILEDQMPEDSIYWPGLSETLDVGPFTVKTTSEVTEKLHIERTIRYTINDGTRDVCLLHYTGKWMSGVTCPADQHDLLDFLTTVNSFIDSDDLPSPLIVQCLDGCAKSGLFAALWLTIERIKCNNEVAVTESVRSIRQRRRQAIHTFEQYQHCYDAARLYIDSIQLYANI